LAIELPERRLRVLAVARPVWHFGAQQAFRLVAVADADRLELAEHVDRVARRLWN
jgi:hypothetical protein